MTDSDIEGIYKNQLPLSHYAGLRAVYDAGYLDGVGGNVDQGTGDQSSTATAPTSDVTITTV